MLAGARTGQIVTPGEKRGMREAEEGDRDGGRDPEDAENGLSPDRPEVPEGYRCGYVAIAGRPNVGKSTLMNRFLKERLAIVTKKPQTTRRRTLGILSGDGYQMILLDTPGLMDPRYDLHHAMLNEARQALSGADVILLLAEPYSRVELPNELVESQAPRILAINKIDTLKSKGELIPILAEWNETGHFRELVPISALDGDGTDELLKVLVGLLPAGPPYYPEDQLTNQPERFFVAEIIRERIFELYEKEVPYSTEIGIEEFKERTGAKDFIEAVIFVEQESQKAIIIGKKGAAIRALGEEAREEIESFLGRPVFLSLRVRILPSWRRRAGALHRLGYKR
jgi:GTPase